MNEYPMYDDERFTDSQRVVLQASLDTSDTIQFAIFIKGFQDDTIRCCYLEELPIDIQGDVLAFYTRNKVEVTPILLQSREFHERMKESNRGQTLFDFDIPIMKSIDPLRRQFAPGEIPMNQERFDLPLQNAKDMRVKEIDEWMGLTHIEDLK